MAHPLAPWTATDRDKYEREAPTSSLHSTFGMESVFTERSQLPVEQVAISRILHSYIYNPSATTAGEPRDLNLPLTSSSDSYRRPKLTSATINTAYSFYKTCSPSLSSSPSLTTFSILPTAKSNFSITGAIPSSNGCGSLRAPTNNQTQRKHSKDDTEGNAEIPTFSLEGLGLSRNMKMVVRATIGVIGTTETLFLM
ncbi:hypothetical protein PAAG_06624 [Paracoccidioides lutzii Pb01]|uniref:Uncharacterized protein n=1 Tax=Paracoccidioides lutzii (strain ATCC MYA-826 / Pb01) TaxID=502779 RepID=C1H783_PARBA|nr:hypothetical protein PAAG_06624 [Paracoccidioides lutzii Pb01]EEH35577.2 hypothetical protein PAAG_06624 [Paracoccidioides lutzii Pb01]